MNPLESIADEHLLHLIVGVVVQLAVVDFEIADRQIKTDGVHGSSAAGFETVQRAKEYQAFGSLGHEDSADKRVVLHLYHLAVNPARSVGQVGRYLYRVSFFHLAIWGMFAAAKVRIFSAYGKKYFSLGIHARGQQQESTYCAFQKLSLLSVLS